MNVPISKWMRWVHGWVRNALKFFFLKKGMTCHTSRRSVVSHWKKNKFSKHCFKWGVLISKCMWLYQNACDYIKMHANCIDRSQNFHRWECNTCHTSPRSVVSHNILHQNAHVYIKMNVLDAWMGHKCTKIFFFWKKAWLVTLLREVLKVIEKKNKFSKHCFKWGMLISKCMWLYQNECTYIKMNVTYTTRAQNLHPVEAQHLSHFSEKCWKS